MLAYPARESWSVVPVNPAKRVDIPFLVPHGVPLAGPPCAPLPIPSLPHPKVSRAVSRFDAPLLSLTLSYGFPSFAFTEWSGINALLYYGPTLVQEIGLKGDTVSLIVSGGIGIVQFFAVLPAIVYIDRVGRKALLRGSCPSSRYTSPCVFLEGPGS